MTELAQLSLEDRRELSFIEVAFYILHDTGEVHDFNHLLEKIQNYLELSDDELEQKMVRFYTDLNVDGRFISLGENRWGLRSWYAIDEIDEEIINSIDDEDLPRHRRRKKKQSINVFDDGDSDMIDYSDDDPEDSDGIYDEIDEEDYENDDRDTDEDEDDEDELPVGMRITDEDEDEDEDKELDDYAEDLSELGDEDLDLDDDDDLALEDDEDDEIDDDEDLDSEDDEE